MNRLVVLSGAGMSAESGIKTFRDHNGLWEEYRVEDVATPEAWNKNPALVLMFYNQRRKQLLEVSPNAGHFCLVELERFFDVQIVTQNVDDLHERAGSKSVLHLHGELLKARSSANPTFIKTLADSNLNLGDNCPMGSQLRPHIVWFGEEVPMIDPAIEIIKSADIVLIVGTSLNVYPAAGLVDFTPSNTPIFIVDPKSIETRISRVQHIKNTAAIGLPILAEQLIKRYS